VFFDGEGYMFLHTGCGNFICVDNLDVDCLVNLKREGDIELRVKVSDNTSCHMHYHNGSDDGDIIDEQNPIVYVFGCFFFAAKMARASRNL
jgi:hypothetical protein